MWGSLRFRRVGDEIGVMVGSGVGGWVCGDRLYYRVVWFCNDFGFFFECVFEVVGVFV